MKRLFLWLRISNLIVRLLISATILWGAVHTNVLTSDNHTQFQRETTNFLRRK